jgi:LemA protein
VAENYPELKSSGSFLSLQNRVSKLEDIISDRREFFNESINLFNIGIHQFPDLFLAKMMNYKSKSLLIVSEQEKHYDGI